MKYILFLLISVFSIYAESTTTSLTDPAQLAIFQDVTTRIRCICLPSLPIKSCSFNNCEVSSLLKVFIENRIRKGEDANTIVSKMLNGFGEDVMSDPIVKKFMDSGNTYMANKIVVGFGPNILAEPDATSINVTIGIFAFLGLSLIGIYFYSRKSKAPDKSPSTNSLPNKYLKEL